MAKKKKKKRIIDNTKLIESLDTVEIIKYENLINKDDCIYTVNKDEKTCTLHKITKIYPTLYIPSTIDGYLVTKLENKNNEAIFEDNEKVQVKKVIIPDTVQELGKHCFNECRNVEAFELGNQLKIISIASFSYCESLKEIILPESVSLIGDYAFRNCKNLQKLTVLNPTCEISNNLYNITNSDNMDKEVGKFDGTIYGWEGSTILNYANKYNKQNDTLRYVDFILEYIGSRPYNKIIKKKDIQITAIWSNGTTEINTNFAHSYAVHKDFITLTVFFDKFKHNIDISIKPREIDGFSVTYEGPKKVLTKTPLNKKDFKAIAHYDDNTEDVIKNFTFVENVLKKSGKNIVTINYKGFEASCQVIAKHKFLLF